MRIGVRVGLPGPFSVSGSIGTRGRRRVRGAASTGCMPWLGLAFIIGLFIKYPALWFFLLAAVLVMISFIARKKLKDPPKTGGGKTP